MQLGLVGVAVAGDDRAVIEFHQQGRVVLAPVRVDHEAREIRQDRGRVQLPGQFARQPRRAHVIGDVAGHVGLGQAQRAAVHELGHGIGRVVAGDQETGGAIGPFDEIGMVRHAPVMSFVHRLGQLNGEVNWVIRTATPVSDNTGGAPRAGAAFRDSPLT